MTSDLIEQFHFLRPDWFYLIIPAILLFVMFRIRQRMGSNWTNAIDPALLPYLIDNSEQKSSRNPLVLALIAWLLAIVALAGPVWQKTPQPVHEREDALIILLDLTRSMYATDVKPNRLVKARRKVLDLLKLRDEGVTGLIVYSGDAHTVSPLTDDSKTIAEMIPAVAPEMMPAPGSRLAPAIKLALKLFTDANVSSGRILVITDEIRDIADSQAIARNNRVAFPISVMSVGTTEGAPIIADAFYREGGFLKDQYGTLIIPKVNQPAIRDFASLAGGRYSPMSLTDEDLDYLLAEEIIQNIEEYRTLERDFDVWFEEGPWLLIILLPLAALAFRRGWLWMLALVIFQPEPAYASLWDDLWKTRDQQALDAMQQGDPITAASLFEDPEWKGAAQYQSEDFAGAANSFGDGIENIISSDSKYNLGNSLAKLGNYEPAINAYEEALALNPDNEDAVFNKELIEKLLESEQNQNNQGEQGDQSESSDESDQGEENQEQSQDQQQSDQASDQDSDEQQQQESDDAKESDDQREQDKASQQQQMAEEDTSPLEDEERQALQQWLRRVPDDPGGLLRRKFEMQYSDRLKRQGKTNPGNQSNW
ncbi:MAG: Ca-activated chloride channel family protein [Candidatus Azotimanducaceae bacterium]|jgi:Ca-activated chloride channel family protein